MTWPSGRRTKHVTVYLSPAELEVWESVRAARLCPPSRADILMEWLIPECEELAATSYRVQVRERCLAALADLRQDPPADFRSYYGRLARQPRRSEDS